MFSDTELRNVAPQACLPRRPGVARCARPTCFTEVILLPRFSNDERILLPEKVDHRIWSVLDAFGWYGFVEAMDVTVIELVKEEMILLLLPRSDIGCCSIANQVTMSHFADSADRFEREDFRVHGGDEQPWVSGDAPRHIARPEKEVGSDVKHVGRSCIGRRGGRRCPLYRNCHEFHHSTY